MGLSPLAHGWSFAAASDGTFCRAISASVCSCLSCLTLKMPCLLKYKQNPSRYCVNPSINQTYVKHLLSTVPGISRQENTKILHHKAWVTNNTGELVAQAVTCQDTNRKEKSLPDSGIPETMVTNPHSSPTPLTQSRAELYTEWVTHKRQQINAKSAFLTCSWIIILSFRKSFLLVSRSLDAESSQTKVIYHMTQ